jgi:hypothetical protein
MQDKGKNTMKKNTEDENKKENAGDIARFCSVNFFLLTTRPRTRWLAVRILAHFRIIYTKMCCNGVF